MALDFVIFGGVGDLSLRKLLPSLYYLFRDGNLEKDCRILCVSRKIFSRDVFLRKVGGKLSEYLDKDFDEDTWQKFSSILSYVDIDLSASIGWPKLVDFLNVDEKKTDRTIIYYLSVMPNLFAPICRKLKEHNLNPNFSRLVAEKPLGENFETALEVNEVLSESFEEKQIYRIDHYLGKEAVQNILQMRFNNHKMDALWNKDHIEQVDINVAETVGVETRIAFMDRVGTLRDMVQNHLMQLLTLVAMDVPESLDGDDIRDQKCKIINDLRPFNDANVALNSIKAHYTSGEVNGKNVPAYQEELDASGFDYTGEGETFVLIKVNIDNDRWHGVPFILRTGKRMSGRFAEIRIKFKAPENNEMVIEIQPDQTILMSKMLKQLMGDIPQLNKHNMSFSLQDGAGEESQMPEAYERLLFEVIKGNQTYFVRDDEIMASWKWIDGIRDAWASTKQELQYYEAGSMGPQFK